MSDLAASFAVMGYRVERHEVRLSAHKDNLKEVDEELKDHEKRIVVLEVPQYRNPIK